jgi:hypothetical protein
MKCPKCQTEIEINKLAISVLSLILEMDEKRIREALSGLTLIIFRIEHDEEITNEDKSFIIYAKELLRKLGYAMS